MEERSVVVGVVDDRFVRYPRLEVVPAGTKVFTSLDEISDEMSIEDISNAYSIVAGVNPKTFPTKEVAASSLWSQFEKLPIMDPDKIVYAAASEEAPKKRAYVVQSKKTYELLPGKNDGGKFVGSLAPQAKQVLLIIVEAAQRRGSGEFTEDELRKEIEDRKELLNTTQDSWRIFQYYRSKLRAGDLIKYT